MLSDAEIEMMSRNAESNYIKDMMGYNRDSSQCLKHKVFPWAMMALAVALMSAVTGARELSRSSDLSATMSLAAPIIVLMAVLALIAWFVMLLVAKKKSKNYINSPFRQEMDMANTIEPVVYEISFKDHMRRFIHIFPSLALIFLFLNFINIFLSSILTPNETVGKAVSDSSNFTVAVIVWALVFSVAIQSYRHFLKTYIAQGRQGKVEA